MSKHPLPVFMVGPTTWNLPGTGGYIGGNMAGLASAKAYMKLLRARSCTPLAGLQHVVLSLGKRMAKAETKTERDSLKGLAVGFWVELQKVTWTACHSKYCSMTLPLESPLIRSAISPASTSQKPPMPRLPSKLTEWVADLANVRESD